MKVIGIILLIVLGLGLFFAPMIYKQLPKLTHQVQQTTQTIKPMLKSAPAPTVAPVQQFSIDKIFDYIQKLFGMASTGIGVFLGIKQLKEKKKPSPHHHKKTPVKKEPK